MGEGNKQEVGEGVWGWREGGSEGEGGRREEEQEGEREGGGGREVGGREVGREGGCTCTCAAWHA